MFDNLTDRLSKTLRDVTGRGRLSEENIQEILRDVRTALLEADVALSVVKDFVEKVKERALGQEILKSLSPAQAFVKIVHDELVTVMGQENKDLNLAVKPPAVILLAVLQGAGKTTTAAKLAKWLMLNKKKKVMLVSADVYRPAAIKQLETLATDINAVFFPSNEHQKPLDIARSAIAEAKTKFIDVVILDTAGRLHIDDDMMLEIKALHQAVQPVETLFVVDSMTGQDAANTAKAFNDVLALSGVILTKTDGDARGGAALSVRMITGKPIKFLGIGETVDGLEAFYPDRMASRILGMGDVLSLVEDVERKIDKEKADRLAKKLKKGKGFDLNDLKDQFQQMRNMGGMSAMMDKLPGMGGGITTTQNDAAEKELRRMEALIDSMTPSERADPDIINGSRKKRVADGAGLQIQDVNHLLKQHKQMATMMKKISQKGGMAKMMRGLGGMMPSRGGMPPFRR